MGTVLVTGGAGFIGYHLSQKLLDLNYHVVSIDNFNPHYSVELKKKRIENIKDEKFSFIEASISDTSEMNKVFEKYNIDFVMNLAAEVGIRDSEDRPIDYVKTNTLAVVNLLEIMKKFNVKNFIQASTSSIYSGNKSPFSIDDKADTPFSVYAASKKSTELICHSYAYQYGFNINILRLFTVYGPFGRPDMAIPKFIKKILANETIEIFGDGEQERDFTYIEDVVDAFILAMNVKGYNIFNVGRANAPISIKKLITLIEELTQKKASITNTKKNNIEMNSTRAKVNETEQKLKWNSLISFKTGLKRTIEWYCDRL